MAFGWLVPGGAYLLRKHYAQFALLLVLVCVDWAVGIALQGSNMWPASAELLGLDGFTAASARAGALAKISAGGPWVVTWLCGYSQSFLSGQTHEYGTTLLIAVGLIQLLALAEAR